MTHATTTHGVTRVRGLGELLAIIPYQFGFEPGRCVVAQLVRGGRLGGAVRLPAPETDWAEVPSEAWSTAARGLLSTWTGGGGAARGPGSRRSIDDGVILAAYDLSDESARQGFELLESACAAVGIPVTEGLMVTSGQWRRLHEDADDADDAAAWEEVPPAVDVPAVSEYVGRGIRPVADRDRLHDRFTVDPVRAEPVRKAIDALAAFGVLEVHGRDKECDLTVERGVPAVTEWLTGAGISHRPQDPAVTAQGLLLLRRPEWRDAVYHLVAPQMSAILGPTRVERAVLSRIPRCRHDADALLSAVAPYAPRGYRAPLLAVTALAAWSRGNGPLAWAAAEEALIDDPGQSMAQTVQDCLYNGLSCDPRQWSPRPQG